MNELLVNRAEKAGPDDVCFLDIITARLAEAGHPNPTEWLSGSELQSSKGMAPSYQRFYINRYWRRRIGSVQQDTQAIRFLLVDSGDNEQWIGIFSTVIVPFIVENKLS
jgi:hypothetical protein